MENMKTKYREIMDAWNEFQRQEEMKTDYRKRTKWIAYFHIVSNILKYTMSNVLRLRKNYKNDYRIKF